MGDGAGTTIIDANNIDRVFTVASGTTVSIENVTITGGDAPGTGVSSGGGGIRNEGGTLTVTNSIVSGNSADRDGGGVLTLGGNVNINGSTISNNAATARAGGLFNEGGTVTITNSSVSDNTAGGGIFNANNSTMTIAGSTVSGNAGTGILTDRATLTVTNSTISGNTLEGILNPSNSGTVTIVNSTITGNAIGVSNTSGANDITLRNTLVVGNTTDINGNVNAASSFNLVGQFANAGGLTNNVNGNIIGDGAGGNLTASTIINTTLADNGGLTQTHALAANSLAIDAGNNALAVDAMAAALTTDQRGFGRILDGGNGTVVDIGAFELRRVIVGQNFTGGQLFLNGNLSIPPDTMGSVGPDHIVELINGRFAIYNKTNGNLIQTSSLDQFWVDAGLAGTSGTVDSRVIYDHASQRWFVTSVNGGAGNSIFIAVSTNSDPTAGWTGFSFVGDTIDGTRFNDFDSLGLDADGVYIATNNFLPGSQFADDFSVYSIPKADLLLAAPTITNMSRFENQSVNGLGASVQPVVDFGPSDGRAALVATFNGNFLGDGFLKRSDILNAGTATANLNVAGGFITVPTFAAAGFASQPGANDDIETGGTRFSGNVVEVGDSLWAAHTVLDAVTGNAVIRWYRSEERRVGKECRSRWSPYH